MPNAACAARTKAWISRTEYSCDVNPHCSKFIAVFSISSYQLISSIKIPFLPIRLLAALFCCLAC